MVPVHVIESLKDDTWYTGMALNAQARLKEHNAGKNRLTKGHMPWKLIYTEQHPSWAEARLREKYFKYYAGKIALKKILQNPEERRLPD
jgi:predicted GIY-YIG superfamily endonuclease